MAHKDATMWGKAILLIGLGLTGLTAFEIGEAALGASDRLDQTMHFARRTQSYPSTQQTTTSDLPTPPEEAIVADAPQVDSLTAVTVDITEQADSTEQTKTLAIDSAPSNGAARPNVTNISPEEFAIAAWAGASFPVENFQAYTSPFGYRRSPTGGYRQEFHYGLDIAAPQGSYIRSWWSGKAVEVTDNTNCGTSVVIQSGSWVHIYCHMQGHVETQNGRRYLIDRSAGVQIWEGQDIVAGDRIGRVGMTGRTTGPHLHWGLKYDGNWVDPAWVIQAMSVSQQAMGQQQ